MEYEYLRSVEGVLEYWSVGLLINNFFSHYSYMTKFNLSLFYPVSSILPSAASLFAFTMSSLGIPMCQYQVLISILCCGLRDSFSAVTRIARLPRTGHSCSQTPQPMHSSGLTTGRWSRIRISNSFPGAGGKSQVGSAVSIRLRSELCVMRRAGQSILSTIVQKKSPVANRPATSTFSSSSICRESAWRTPALASDKPDRAVGRYGCSRSHCVS